MEELIKVNILNAPINILDSRNDYEALSSIINNVVLKDIKSEAIKNNLTVTLKYIKEPNTIEFSATCVNKDFRDKAQSLIDNWITENRKPV